MRIFKDCQEMIKEIDRELHVAGQTVEVKHYQNKQLEGKERETKELVGVAFKILRPQYNKYQMLEHVFEEDANRIVEYCACEFQERKSKDRKNPGNSYKIRPDMWHKFLNNEDKFDYTYSERIGTQFKTAVNTLIEDPGSRQAMVLVYNPSIDEKRIGGEYRIPCSISYQFLIRNNQVHIIYYMRSNDYYGHFPIDIYLASDALAYVTNQLNMNGRKNYGIGTLTYFAGSLHAYSWDLKKHVVF